MSSLIERGHEIVTNAPQLYIDVDCEFDGPTGYGSLLSIGAVTPDGETYYTELQPDRDSYTDHQRQFCKDHGLERERLKREGAKPRAAMQEFSAWTDLQATRQRKRPVLTAFNAPDDFGHINLRFIEHGIKNPYGIAPFCLKSMAQFLGLSWDWRHTAKDQLPPEILPDGDFTHHALEDAIYQQHIHFGLAALLEGMRAGKVL